MVKNRKQIIGKVEGKVILTSPLCLSQPPTYYFGIEDRKGMKTRVHFTGNDAETWSSIKVKK